MQACEGEHINPLHSNSVQMNVSPLITFGKTESQSHNSELILIFEETTCLDSESAQLHMNECTYTRREENDDLISSYNG